MFILIIIINASGTVVIPERPSQSDEEYKKADGDSESEEEDDDDGEQSDEGDSSGVEYKPTKGDLFEEGNKKKKKSGRLIVTQFYHKQS